MALLVGEAIQRDVEGGGKGPGRALSREEAGHIGALHGAGPGGDADGPDLRRRNRRKQAVG